MAKDVQRTDEFCFGKVLSGPWGQRLAYFVLGFSMPPTDTHFRYLLTAGLQENISLRKFFFVNPGLDEKAHPNESTRLRENLFGILRPELEDRNVIELLPQKTMELLLDIENRQILTATLSLD